jgi:hypothetical protein
LAREVEPADANDGRKDGGEERCRHRQREDMGRSDAEARRSATERGEEDTGSRMEADRREPAERGTGGLCAWCHPWVKHAG